MTRDQLKEALKAAKEKGYTTIDLRSSTEAMKAEYNRIYAHHLEVNENTDIEDYCNLFLLDQDDVTEPLEFLDGMLATRVREHYEVRRNDYSKPYGHLGRTYPIQWKDIELVSVESLVELPEAGGSDYSNSTDQRSNYEYLTHPNEFEFAHLIVESYGAHGTYQAFVRVIDLIENEAFCDAIREYIECVSEYAVFNDDHYHELEERQKTEAWKGSLEHDFMRAVEVKRQIGDLQECVILDHGQPEGIDPLKLRCEFERLASENDVYWMNSEGYSMWICVEEVAEHVTNLTEFCQAIA